MELELTVNVELEMAKIGFDYWLFHGSYWAKTCIGCVLGLAMILSMPGTFQEKVEFEMGCSISWAFSHHFLFCTRVQ